MTGPRPSTPILLDRASLAARIRALADQIQRDHPDGVVLVGVLKGALIFLADLARAIQDVDVMVDFLAISRYAPDSGRVRILKDLDLDVAGRDVVVVEDVIDTGLTLAYLLEHLRGQGPRRTDVCVLLDRAERRIVPMPLRYVGLEIPGNAFVLGYGLHVGERYRNLPQVIEAAPEALTEDPDAYLAWYDHAPGEADDGAMLG